MKQTEYRLNLNGREFILIGTAHISAESVEEVKQAVEAEKPDCVAIELDDERLKTMTEEESWKNLDIVSVLKKNQGFVLMANLILASFQKKMGSNVGVKPGDDMRAAYDKATELGIKTAMVDRPVKVTLRRAWAKNSFIGKMKLLSLMIASIFDTEEVSSDQIENLKNSSEMDNMMSELSSYLPAVKQVLIDERDFYLASHIYSCSGNRVLAVLGAGHIPGVIAHLNAIAEGKESSDTSEIGEVPEKKVSAKIIGWLIPVLIVALIALGFYFGGKKNGWNMMGSWVIWNSVLAGFGALIAAGHPITVLVSAVSAPFTSLCPLVGCGMVAGLVQAIVKKPKVSDLENLHQDTSSVKGFYKNRILRVLLVFVLSSLGSSIGTFVAGASFIKTITEVITRLVS